MASASIVAQPTPVAVDTARCALVIIDMQRDFLEPGGFGEALGNDVSQLRREIVAPLRAAAGRRARGRHHRHPYPRGASPRHDGCPRAKVERGAPAMRIGDRGPMGRILDPRRGRARHHPGAISRCRRARARQAGKGAFYQTDST